MDKRYKFTLVVGQPQSGKTHFSRKMLESVNNALVYNFGRATDWPGYGYANKPEPGKKLIMGNLDDICRKVEREYRGTFVIDDAGSVVRHGFSSDLLKLASRINHMGGHKYEKTGGNMVMIYHSVNQINPAAWRFATDVVLFKTVSTKIEKSGVDLIDNADFSAITKHLNAQKYNFVHLDLFNTQIEFHQPC